MINFKPKINRRADPRMVAKAVSTVMRAWPGHSLACRATCDSMAGRITGQAPWQLMAHALD